jgi:hypothetical protein
MARQRQPVDPVVRADRAGRKRAGSFDDLADAAVDGRRNTPCGVPVVLAVLAEKKVLKGTTIGVDATTLEANAALRIDRTARYGRALRIRTIPTRASRR